MSTQLTETWDEAFDAAVPEEHSGVVEPSAAESELDEVLLRLVAAIAEKPRLRPAAEAVAALHDEMISASNSAVDDILSLQGMGLVRAIFESDSLLAAAEESQADGSLTAGKLVGAIPLVGLAEVGNRLGFVETGTPLWLALQKAGAWIHVLRVTADVPVTQDAESDEGKLVSVVDRALTDAPVEELPEDGEVEETTADLLGFLHAAMRKSLQSYRNQLGGLADLIAASQEPPDEEVDGWLFQQEDGKAIEPVQNYDPDQPRDDHGQWIEAGAAGTVSHDDIDAANLPVRIAERSHEALGRHERGEEIARIARESVSQPTASALLTPVQFADPPEYAKAVEAKAEPLPSGTHLEVLKELYERAGALRTTHEQIEEHLASLSKLSGRDVVQLARDFGIEYGANSRAAALKKIGDRLSIRLGHAERGAEITAVARGPVQNVGGAD